MLKTIRVTAADIRKGQAADGTVTNITEQCAIACAVRRAFPKAKNVWWAYAEGQADLLELRSIDGHKTATFVIAHDAKKEVKPMQFQVIVRKRPGTSE
jgi:hypothetical protein